MFHHYVFIVLNNQINPKQTLKIIGQQTSVRHKSLQIVRGVELIQAEFLFIYFSFGLCYLTLLRVGVCERHCGQMPRWLGLLMFSVDASPSAEINFAAITSDSTVNSCSIAGRTATRTSTRSTATYPR